MIENSTNTTVNTKANALLCRSCCVEYIEVQFDLQVDDLVLKNVKALRCPNCEEEVFTEEQIEAIKTNVKDKF